MTPAPIRPFSRAGFSLIETVIAVAIAGAAFFVLTETFFNVLLTLESLESEADHQKDVRFVRSQVIQLSERDELEEGGEIMTLDLGEARWQAEVESTSAVDLYRLRLEIEFENPDAESIQHQETLYLLRPTWLDDSFERSEVRAEVQKVIEEKARRRDW
ncbi:MAG: prepilin-type N-terminal cleavage/methylation domain-containing protein [Oceanipulchritudo sp.]